MVHVLSVVCAKNNRSCGKNATALCFQGTPALRRALPHSRAACCAAVGSSSGVLAPSFAPLQSCYFSTRGSNTLTSASTPPPHSNSNRCDPGRRLPSHAKQPVRIQTVRRLCGRADPLRGGGGGGPGGLSRRLLPPQGMRYGTRPGIRHTCYRQYKFTAGVQRARFAASVP